MKAKDFIKKELGVPVDLLFKEFEDRPIAAASLGQVFVSCFHLFYIMKVTHDQKSLLIKYIIYDGC